MKDASQAHRFWHNTSLRAGATRALLLPLTSVAALVTAHIEIKVLGPSLFGVLTLLLAIALLLPFADLGMGAAVTNAVAARERGQRHERLIAASLRLLVFVAVALVGLGALLSALGLWGSITGVSQIEAPSLNRDMLLVILLFAVGLPLGIGGRILLGLDRYPLFLLTQGSIPFVTLAIVFVFRRSREITPFLVAPFVAQVVALCIALVVALSFLQLGPSRLWQEARLAERQLHREIRRTAVPMLVITIGLPIALQTDRLVLSHVATRADLSRYAIVSMLYIPAWSIIGSAGMSLWPRFARLEADSGVLPARAYQKAFRAFLVVGLTGSIALVLLGPRMTDLWAGRNGGGLLLWLMFGLLLVVQSAHLPGAMFLTRPTGLRFQAACVTAMCVVNLPLSILLASSWGAAGPVVASASTIFVFQFLTARWRILRGSGDTEPTPRYRRIVRRI